MGLTVYVYANNRSVRQCAFAHSACYLVISVGVQHDMVDLHEVASRGLSALEDILVIRLRCTFCIHCNLTPSQSHP